MPQTKYYVVTQTREVKVTANSEVDAVRISAMALSYGQNADNGIRFPESAAGIMQGVWGNTTSPIEVIETIVKKVG